MENKLVPGILIGNYYGAATLADKSTRNAFKTIIQRC